MLFSKLILLTTGGGTGSGGGGAVPPEGDIMSLLVSMLPIILMVAVMYFMIIRPQNKRKKAEQKMRNNLQVGDEITTIGGIMGRVVSIKEETDSIVIETGADRSKVRIKKWAVGSCDTVHEEAEAK